jgi:hypothetical protein
MLFLTKITYNLYYKINQIGKWKKLKIYFHGSKKMLLAQEQILRVALKNLKKKLRRLKINQNPNENL